jgi:hypothetical protein
VTGCTAARAVCSRTLLWRPARARACSGVMLRVASLSGGTSERRNTVPVGGGCSWRFPAARSGSTLPMGTGIAPVFQIS